MDDEAVRDQQPSAANPARGDGVVGRLQRVCRDAALALSASGVGVSVIAENGAHGMATASDPATERIEELQFTFGEGPCVDAFATSRPVLMADLTDGATGRWPRYAPAVHDAGVRAVFAFPLQVGAARLGVLDVFRTHTGPLSRQELGEAFTFADRAVTALLDGQEQATTAAIGLLQQRAISRGEILTEQLQGALNSRVVIEQAKGTIAQAHNVDVDVAFTLIRTYARRSNRRLSDVANLVVNDLRSLPELAAPDPR